MSDVFSGELPSVSDLVGEGKKYSTPEKALESLPHKEILIASLQEQVKGLHEELSKAKALDEVLEKLKSPQETATTNRQDPGVDTQSLYKELEQRLNEIRQVQGNLDEKIKQTVTSTLSETSEQQSRQSNRKSVEEALKTAFGETAAHTLAEKAKELGVTPQDLGALAERSPKAVLAYFNIQSSGNTASVNTSANLGNGVREGTYKYYENLRKTNPTKYFDPKLQARLLEDRKRLGNSFFD